MVSRVTVNGVTYSGSNVVVKNGRVVIDGVEASVDKDAKEIRIEVNGDLGTLDVGACHSVHVNGNVSGSVKVSAGDVTCGNVLQGDVSSQAGNIRCGNVNGSVKTQAGDISHTIASSPPSSGSPYR